MMRLQRQIIAALRSQLNGGKVRPPEGGAILWRAFGHLSRHRTWHAHGANPITFPEIEAYCRLMRLPLEPRHIQIISAMDKAWLEDVMAKALPADKGQAKRLPPMSKQPITAKLLDMMLG